MRTWDTYVQLEATVKNMLTSLRAVGELQNQAIRERHWHQLMTSTKVGAVSMSVRLFCVCLSLHVQTQYLLCPVPSEPCRASAGVHREYTQRTNNFLLSSLFLHTFLCNTHPLTFANNSDYFVSTYIYLISISNQ